MVETESLDFYHRLADCIADCDPQYREELCRAFRINPNDVVPNRLKGSRVNSEGEAV